MASRNSTFVSRRSVLAAAPVGILTGAVAHVTWAQPAASDPVSFYLGQVLALATLQAQAVGRLQPLLVNANAADGAWQAAASAEAGVIGAVASVLGGMEPPPELSASVDELRLASEAYRGAADAARIVAGGDVTALDIAGARLAEGATHILLWLDALTAETGNDWGDGLRTLAAGASPAPVAADVQVETPTEPAAAAAAEDVPTADGPAEDAPANRQARNRQNRQDQQNEDEESSPNRQNRQNREERAAAEE